MSYFATALKQLMSERNTTARDIAKKAKFHDSKLSRILSGTTAGLRDERDLDRILVCFERNAAGTEKTPMDQARLVAANCMDGRRGPGSELVDISIRSPGSDARQPAFKPLPRDVEGALKFLEDSALANPKHRKFIVQLAEILGAPVS